MAEPDWNPDTAGRPLAEILREAGIESAARSGRRRRWDDPDETGLRQRRAEAAAESRPGFGRRAGDLTPTDGSRRPVPEPSTAAIPGLRPSRTPDVPGPAAATVAPAAPPQRDRGTPDGDRRMSDRRGASTVGGVEADRGASGTDRATAGTDRRGAEKDRRGAEEDRRGAEEDRRGAEEDRRATGRTSSQRDRRAVAPAGPPGGEDFSTGPIPIVRDGDVVLTDEEATPRESALAWLRFTGELVIALAAGVGVYFLATVLWEQLPYLAVVLAPLAVTGLVAGVSLFRRRMGKGPMSALLLAVLVFAGALLTVAPAADLLAG